MFQLTHLLEAGEGKQGKEALYENSSIFAVVHGTYDLATSSGRCAVSESQHLIAPPMLHLTPSKV